MKISFALLSIYVLSEMQRVKSFWLSRTRSKACLFCNVNENESEMIRRQRSEFNNLMNSLSRSRIQRNVTHDQSNDEQRVRKLKARQHVNPLASNYQTALELPESWLQQSFSRPGQDIILDIGCAKGSWALQYAQNHPEVNILGLEIRRPVVDYCNSRRRLLDLSNAHFLAVNANVNLESILSHLSQRSVIPHAITIQFPDPHYKTKHIKRRLVNKEFVTMLARHLPPQSQVFLQTDLDFLMEDMLSHFLSSSLFAADATSAVEKDKWSENASPFDIKTEREISVLLRGLPVYRILLRRC